MSKVDSFEQLIQEERERRDSKTPASRPQSKSTWSYSYSSDSDGVLVKVVLAFFGLAVSAGALLLIALLFSVIWIPPLLHALGDNAGILGTVCRQIGLNGYENAITAGYALSLLGLVSCFAVARRLFSS